MPRKSVEPLRRQELTDAAIEVIAQHGLGAATTQMIAARAADFILGKSQLAPEQARFHFRGDPAPSSILGHNR